MTHTFDSEVSLHYWIIWPTVRHPFTGVYRTKKDCFFIMAFMRLFSLGNNVCEYSNNFGVSIDDALSSILGLTVLN